MTFLRKRSRSQCSTLNGEEDCRSVRSDRKELNERSLVERRYSGVSDMSYRPDDYGVHDSCVIRNFPKHKSSHLRFLAWVAYTRKYDDQSITDDERRTCPLLWCREVFPDQETMLKHVWECEHLSKGLYWCFHCQKPERVGKFQCRRCQGLPSKTDRLATVAKRIFSKLGAKHQRDDCAAPRPEANGRISMALSKIPESSESDDFPEIQDNFDHEDFPAYEELPELPNTYISEMENTSIMPEMDSSWIVSPQGSHIVDEKASEYCADSYSSAGINTSDHSFSQSHPPWSPSSFQTPLPAAHRSPGRSVPALALNTRDIYQPPSSRCQLGRTRTLSDEPMSATVISPLSATDGFFSGMLGQLVKDIEVSPTDSEATCNSFFTDSGYASATIESAWSATTMDFDPIWDIHDTRKKSDLGVFPVLSGSKAENDVGLMKPPAQPLSTSLSNAPSRSSSNSSNHSANRCTALIKRKSLSPHWTNSKTMVESFVVVLNEHLEHSRMALKQLPSNSTIKELLAMSSASIISIGFDVLRGLLEKRNPTAIISIFAFCHLAYAMAISVDDKSSKVQSEKWFRDSICWFTGLSSERQRMSYTLIAQAIWKPQDLTEMADVYDFGKLTEMAQPSIGHENRLVKACKHFLDIQENLWNNEQGSASQCSLSRTSSFNFSQASFHRITKSRIIDELIQKVSIEAFIEDVVSVEKRLHDGSITNLRQLELELICAGKLASQSDVAYERFLSHVTCLCDTLYSEGESETSRIEYQIKNIDITKSLIPEENSGDEDSHENVAFEFEYLGNDHNVSMHYGTSYASLEEFVKDADEVSEEFNNFTTSVPPCSHSNPFQVPTPALSTIPNSPFPTLPISAPTPTPMSRACSNSVSPQKYKCHCGYVPQGEEKWKASNLARHKRTQHPVELKTWKCAFPGCASRFTRSDNLRSHMRDKGHNTRGLGRKCEERKRECDENDWEERRRTGKRRKMSEPKEKGESDDDALDSDAGVLNTGIVPQ